MKTVPDYFVNKLLLAEFMKTVPTYSVNRYYILITVVFDTASVHHRQLLSTWVLSGSINSNIAQLWISLVAVN